MEERELELGEIIEDAMTFLDFGPEALTCCEPDGCFCDMEPEELELARASIAYMGYQLLLEYRMKKSNAHQSAGGWVAKRHFESEIRREIASVLGIRGTFDERNREVKRLYAIARKAEENGDYNISLDGIIQDIEEKYDLDAESLGIVFI